jgi:hypothetical protein
MAGLVRNGVGGCTSPREWMPGLYLYYSNRSIYFLCYNLLLINQKRKGKRLNLHLNTIAFNLHFKFFLIVCFNMRHKLTCMLHIFLQI